MGIVKPWWKVVTPRKEVLEGRSFNPDEFAVALDQVVNGAAPDDYRDPRQFFARTCWTASLKEHIRTVLRRLSGATSNAAPVIALNAQFGGGKTHALTALYHIATTSECIDYPSVSDVLDALETTRVSDIGVAVFVGTAWDPQPGRETPWIDVIRQIAGDVGVELLGPAARVAPPGTETLGRVFTAVNRPILLLFDEVLNFLNRHRDMADSFYSFIHNLTVAAAGTRHVAAVFSLPRSQLEMTDWDVRWQERIAKVVHRLSKDIVADDAVDIGEIVCRRLFEGMGNDAVRSSVVKSYADWCFNHRHQIACDLTTVSPTKNQLIHRFESCYPFHPATISVFQRKWRGITQFQQTRGILAVLAQWIVWTYQRSNSPLVSLDTAPLHIKEFRDAVLSQLGEPQLVTAIESDIIGDHSHAMVLDQHNKSNPRDIHHRVGTAIFFESAGGQSSDLAHIPELRFAVGNPWLDIASIDNAAINLETSAYFIRKLGSDGFKISCRPTIKKLIHDRCASLDDTSDVEPAMCAVVEREFRRKASVPIIVFPSTSNEIPDTPRLKIVVADPRIGWCDSHLIRHQIADWIKRQNGSPRRFPGALVWCVSRQYQGLYEKTKLWLAWQRIAQDLADGLLDDWLDPSDRDTVQDRLARAETALKEEVWSSYHFVIIHDPRQPGDLRVIDLAVDGSLESGTLCERVIHTLKSLAILSDSVGVGYIERHWPPACVESGAWSLVGLQQSFASGLLVRLIDPETTLRTQIAEFVKKGDFGLAIGDDVNGTYSKVYYQTPLTDEDIRFHSDVFLLTKAKVQSLLQKALDTAPQPKYSSTTIALPADGGQITTIHITGTLPFDAWNKVGIQMLSRLKACSTLKIDVNVTATMKSSFAGYIVNDLATILDDLGIADSLSLTVDDGDAQT